MAITLRSEKGTKLTQNEVDENFSDLRDGVNILVPKTQGKGIKIDETSPEFGWHDIVGNMHVYGEPSDAVRGTYRGGIKALQFDVSDQAYIDFHMPHDYAMGTNIYIHVHWSHDSATVTGGTTTWAFEMMYAKGHNQEPFGTTVIASVIDNVSTTQYQHQIAEVLASSVGGSGSTLDLDSLEVDGIFQCRLYLDSNDITDSVSVPNPFAHFVDIHYQSTGVPTKRRAPDFWT